MRIVIIRTLAMYRSIACRNMKQLMFKTNEAAAIQRGAMETETISKNGARPKSLMSRGNIFKIVAALLVASLSFSAYAGPKVLDKSVAKEESAFLCFSKDYSLVKINDKGLGIGGFQVIKGKGSDKKPGVIYQIPAGECKISAEYVNYGRVEATAELQAGRYYQILMVEPSGGVASFAKMMGGKYDLEFKDITDTVKK